VSTTLKRTIRYNGREYSRPAELPPYVRKVRWRIADCDDVMSLIENNGEVTIPKPEPLLTKKKAVIVAAFGAGIVALVLARIAHG
jgi:hypothetical protein